MPLGLLSLLLPNKHSQDLLPCLPLSVPLVSFHHPSSSVSVILNKLWLIVWSSFLLSYQLFHHSLMSPCFTPSCSHIFTCCFLSCVSSEDALSPCVGNVDLSFLSCVLFMRVTRWREDSDQGLLMYAAGPEGIYSANQKVMAQHTQNSLF